MALTLINGNDEIKVDDWLELGRDPNTKRLQIKDLLVSRFHCVLYKRRNKYYVADCGSVNGTFLNTKRVSEAKKASIPIELRDTDVLKVGNTNFIVKIEPLVLRRKDKERLRLEEVERMKRNYGIDELPLNPAPTRTFRDNEISNTPKETIQTKEAPLDASNKGMRLLKRMGWKEGQGIGNGIKEPINLKTQKSTRGLGK